MHLVERKTEGRKPDKNASLRRLEFMPRNLEKKFRLRIPSQERDADIVEWETEEQREKEIGRNRKEGGGDCETDGA